jgi:hypothetical protein
MPMSSETRDAPRRHSCAKWKSTWWPVSAAFTAMSAVSLSRISTDHDDIRILTQNGPERVGEARTDVGFHRYLIDARSWYSTGPRP